MLRFLLCQFREMSSWLMPVLCWEHIKSNLNTIVLRARLAIFFSKYRIMNNCNFEDSRTLVTFHDGSLYLVLDVLSELKIKIMESILCFACHAQTPAGLAFEQRGAEETHHAAL